jgi:hypothetical protein
MDEARLNDFMGKLVSDMGGAAMLANVILGEELGLYRAMADSQPVTLKHSPARPAATPPGARVAQRPRRLRLYGTHDGQFRLPEEQALALAIEDSPVYIAGGIGVVASFFHDKDKLINAMRGDGALPWGDHHPCMFSGTERFFRPGYKAHLIAEWLPALDGVVAKLEAGAKVADIGCGHGASTVIMAQAFPSRDLSASTTTRPPSPSPPSAPKKVAWPVGRDSSRARQRATPATTMIWSAISTACTTWATRSARPDMPTSH